MARLDTSRAAALRVQAEQLRRRARDMTLTSYIAMMERAATELESEARALDEEDDAGEVRLGRRLDIHI